VPRYVRDLRSEDVVLRAKYRIGGEPTGPSLTFAVPLSGLEPHLQHEPRPVVPQVNRAALERDLATNLGAVAVQMSVRVGTSRLKLRDVVGLQPGDVVVLDRQINEPCEPLVEGEPKFAGFLGQHAGTFTWKMAHELASNAASREDAREVEGKR
jgi:flagellar motor switch protein FliM